MYQIYTTYSDKELQKKNMLHMYPIWKILPHDLYEAHPQGIGYNFIFHNLIKNLYSMIFDLKLIKSS